MYGVEKSLDNFVARTLIVVLVGEEEFGFRGRDEAKATRLEGPTWDVGVSTKVAARREETARVSGSFDYRGICH